MFIENHGFQVGKSCVVLYYDQFLGEATSEVQTVIVFGGLFYRVLNIPSKLVTEVLRFPPEGTLLVVIALEVLRTVTPAPSAEVGPHFSDVGYLIDHYLIICGDLEEI